MGTVRNTTGTVLFVFFGAKRGRFLRLVDNGEDNGDGRLWKTGLPANANKPTSFCLMQIKAGPLVKMGCLEKRNHLKKVRPPRAVSR